VLFVAHIYFANILFPITLQALLKKEMDNLEQQNDIKPNINNERKSTQFGPPYQNPEVGLNPPQYHQPHHQQGFNNNNNNMPGHPVNPWNQYGESAMESQFCKFYVKTGACRFGARCSRMHPKKEHSPTIMIQNFFHDARLAIPMLNERNNDAAIEYDEVDVILEYEKFYDDVIGEFRAAGTVVMFKCCQNFVPHLRGNVYVQFTKHDEALEAMRMFNGRFYAGRQLSVELSPVTNWRSSICGLFDKRLCPRGKACNFLHVFRNPGNAYSVPNRTDFDPERARRQGGFDPAFINLNHPVLAYYNQRDSYGYRSEKSIRSSGNRKPTNKWDNTRYERSRSRSRDRSDRKRRRRSHSRSRSKSRGRSHSRSRSCSRSRSRSDSRDRSHRRSRRSRSRTRSKSRSRSKDRSKRSRKHSRSSDSSRGSRRSRKNSSEISDTSTDWSDISDD